MGGVVHGLTAPLVYAAYPPLYDPWDPLYPHWDPYMRAWYAERARRRLLFGYAAAPPVVVAAAGAAAGASASVAPSGVHVPPTLEWFRGTSRVADALARLEAGTGLRYATHLQGRTPAEQRRVLLAAYDRRWEALEDAPLPRDFVAVLAALMPGLFQPADDPEATSLRRHLLAIAGETGDVEAVRALWKWAGLNVLDLRADQNDVLLHAARDNNLAMVRFLALELGLPIVPDLRADGDLAFELATWRGNDEVARFLYTHTGLTHADVLATGSPEALAWERAYLSGTRNRAPTAVATAPAAAAVASEGIAFHSPTA